MTTRSNLIVRYRSAVNDFLSAFEHLESLSNECDILNPTFVDGDIGTGDLTAAQFSAGVASFKSIYSAFVGSASAKNIYLLRQ